MAAAVNLGLGKDFLFTTEFIDMMTDNMWTYFNPDIVEYILHEANLLDYSLENERHITNDLVHEETLKRIKDKSQTMSQIDIEIKNKQNNKKNDVKRIMYTDLFTELYNEEFMKTLTKPRNLSKVLMLYKEDVDDDVFDVRYKNSVVFKGALGTYMPNETENLNKLRYSAEGHYVFVNKNMKVFGTYEDNILMAPEDDGICHGYALLCAFMENDPDRTKFPEFNPNNITRYPLNADLSQKDISSIAMNYFMILNFYLFIINKGWWLKAVNIYFPPNKPQPKNIHEKEIDKIIQAINKQLIILEPFITETNSKYNLANNNPIFTKFSQNSSLMSSNPVTQSMEEMKEKIKEMADTILTLQLINLKKKRVNNNKKAQSKRNKPSYKQNKSRSRR